MLHFYFVILAHHGSVVLFFAFPGCHGTARVAEILSLLKLKNSRC